jgi:adenylate cyclase
VFFNDPLPVADPAPRAVRMALQMQVRTAQLADGWRRRGYALQLGIGIAMGFATIGAIGFPGRIDYGAIGNVTNLAARLCGEAAGGEILVAPRVVAALGDAFAVEPAGEFTLKGLHRAVSVGRVLGERA